MERLCRDSIRMPELLEEYILCPAERTDEPIFGKLLFNKAKETKILDDCPILNYKLHLFLNSQILDFFDKNIESRNQILIELLEQILKIKSYYYLQNAKIILGAVYKFIPQNQFLRLLRELLQGNCIVNKSLGKQAEFLFSVIPQIIFQPNSKLTPELILTLAEEARRMLTAENLFKESEEDIIGVINYGSEILHTLQDGVNEIDSSLEKPRQSFQESLYKCILDWPHKIATAENCHLPIWKHSYALLKITDSYDLLTPQMRVRIWKKTADQLLSILADPTLSLSDYLEGYRYASNFLFAGLQFNCFAFEFIKLSKRIKALIKAAEVLLYENQNESIVKEILSSLWTLLTAEFGESKPNNEKECVVRSQLVLDLLEKISLKHRIGGDFLSIFFTKSALKRIFPNKKDLIKARKYLAIIGGCKQKC